MMTVTDTSYNTMSQVLIIFDSSIKHVTFCSVLLHFYIIFCHGYVK